MVAQCDSLYLSMTASTMKTVSQCFRPAELKMLDDNCRETNTVTESDTPLYHGISVQSGLNLFNRARMTMLIIKSII